MKHVLFLFFLMVCSFRSAHPLKMSVCDLEYQTNKGYLTLKFKFFWDDLGAALEKKTGGTLTLNKPSPENDQLLAAFINQHFLLKINGLAVKPRLYKTYIQDVVLVVECLGEGFQPASVYNIELRNQILLDVFPDQYNIVRFDFWGNGNLETLRFEKSERELYLQIKK